MAYTKDEILEQIKNVGILGLYDAPCVKTKGETEIVEENEKSVPYTEVVAEWVLKNINSFASRETFVTIDRDDYYVSDKNKKKVKDAPKEKKKVLNKDRKEDEDWDEEWIAKFMYNDGKNDYDSVGHIFCCQVPLQRPKGNKNETPEEAQKREQENAGVGNIDMVSYDGKNVYLLELKKRTNTTDSLLRSALEVFKYWKHLNHTNFRNSYYKYIGMSLTVPIIPAILIFKDSLQQDQYNSQNYDSTRELIKRLGIKVFLAEEIGHQKYSIEEAKD